MTQVAGSNMATSTMLNGHSHLNGIHKSSSIWRPTEVRNHKRETFAFDSMNDALAAFEAGDFLVVMDDENRENEGDLIISAAHCTTEKMAWMIKHTRCVDVTVVFAEVIRKTWNEFTSFFSSLYMWIYTR